MWVYGFFSRLPIHIKKFYLSFHPQRNPQICLWVLWIKILTFHNNVPGNKWFKLHFSARARVGLLTKEQLWRQHSPWQPHLCLFSEGTGMWQWVHTSPACTLHSCSSHLTPFNCLHSYDWHSCLECLFIVSLWLFSVYLLPVKKYVYLFKCW